MQTSEVEINATYLAVLSHDVPGFSVWATGVFQHHSAC